MGGREERQEWIHPSHDPLTPPLGLGDFLSGMKLDSALVFACHRCTPIEIPYLHLRKQRIARKGSGGGQQQPRSLAGPSPADWQIWAHGSTSERASPFPPNGSGSGSTFSSRWPAVEHHQPTHLDSPRGVVVGRSFGAFRREDCRAVHYRYVPNNPLAALGMPSCHFR